MIDRRRLAALPKDIFLDMGWKEPSEMTSEDRIYGFALKVGVLEEEEPSETTTCTVNIHHTEEDPACYSHLFMTQFTIQKIPNQYQDIFSGTGTNKLHIPGYGISGIGNVSQKSKTDLYYGIKGGYNALLFKRGNTSNTNLINLSTVIQGDYNTTYNGSSPVLMFPSETYIPCVLGGTIRSFRAPYNTGGGVYFTQEVSLSLSSCDQDLEDYLLFLTEPPEESNS